jgi:CHAD domain-containing protein
MSALAQAFVRPLLREQCAAVREGASRVIGSASSGQIDPEAIHDYRVALRRLRTLLKAAEPLFKRKATARVRDGLRRFARAAGDVRDEEVLAETLGRITLPQAIRERVDAWLANRARRERALRSAVIAQLQPAGDAAALLEAPGGDGAALPGAAGGSGAALPGAAGGDAAARLEAPGGGGAGALDVPGDGAEPALVAGSGGGLTALAPASESAPKSARRAAKEPAARSRLRRAPMSLSHALTLAQELPLRKRASAVSTRALAVRAMERAARKVKETAARPDAETPPALHELRIAWKGVRYTGELFAGAIAAHGPAAEAMAARIKAATRMQKRLGDIHDLDEAIASVARARSLRPGDRMVVHHRLRTERAAQSARLAKDLPAALAHLAGVA